MGHHYMWLYMMTLFRMSSMSLVIQMLTCGQPKEFSALNQHLHRSCLQHLSHL